MKMNMENDLPVKDRDRRRDRRSASDSASENRRIIRIELVRAADKRKARLGLDGAVNVSLENAMNEAGTKMRKRKVVKIAKELVRSAARPVPAVQRLMSLDA